MWRWHSFLRRLWFWSFLPGRAGGCSSFPCFPFPSLSVPSLFVPSLIFLPLNTCPSSRRRRGRYSQPLLARSGLCAAGRWARATCCGRRPRSPHPPRAPFEAAAAVHGFEAATAVDRFQGATAALRFTDSKAQLRLCGSRFESATADQRRSPLASPSSWPLPLPLLALPPRAAPTHRTTW